jgi:3-phenylpropionate/trans-cinnamate dioxygenase ferredoxin reductase subunit
MPEQIVIVGAGHASGQFIATLKQKKFGGRIVLVGEEHWYPYQRPPLSKKFLAGELPPERLYFKPESFYADANIDVRLNTRVTEIDRSASVIRSEDGQTIPYDKLVLALGSRPREIAVPGIDSAGVHYLRGIQDVENIQRALAPGARIVIIGAGYIGLEVAAVTRKLGMHVTVVEMQERVMSRVVSREISSFFEQEHQRQGVTLMLNSGVNQISASANGTVVHATGGELPAADVVVVGAGVLPNTELAQSAGLDVDDGIVVDDGCFTSDSSIFAIGDCTSHPNAIYERRLRLESVHNALEQAKTAALNIVGEESHYSQVPWFWSDQYDLKLQIAGLSQGFDRTVLRGSVSDRSFSVAYLRQGRLIAVDSVNNPKDFMQSKALIATQACIDAERLGDSAVALKELGA